MIIDSEQLMAACIATKAKTGEDYMSLRISIDLHRDTQKFSCQAYTSVLGHTADCDSPDAALSALLAIPADKEKLIAEAKAFEEKAEILRLRAAGVKDKTQSL